MSIKIGMLWFDNDPKVDLAEKITKAAEYYTKKYGQKPTLCFVHPSMKNKTGEEKIAGLTVRTTRSVLPNHLWLGIQ